MLLGADFARALAGRAGLRRDLAPPRHNRARPLHGETTLPNEIVPALASGQLRRSCREPRPSRCRSGKPSGSVSVTGTLPPSAATRNGIEDRRLDLLLVVDRPTGAARPKIEENRSPSPPNEPRSDKSKSASGPMPSRRRARTPDRARERSVARSWSYFFRFCASLQDVVRLIDLLEALGGLRFGGLRSGWYCLARRRNAF